MSTAVVQTQVPPAVFAPTASCETFVFSHPESACGTPPPCRGRAPFAPPGRPIFVATAHASEAHLPNCCFQGFGETVPVFSTPGNDTVAPHYVLSPLRRPPIPLHPGYSRPGPRRALNLIPPWVGPEALHRFFSHQYGHNADARQPVPNFLKTALGCSHGVLFFFILLSPDPVLRTASSG